MTTNEIFSIRIHMSLTYLALTLYRNVMTVRGGRVIQEQKHVKQRLLCLEYKAKWKGIIRVFKRKKTKGENATTCLRLYYISFANSVQSIAWTHTKRSSLCTLATARPKPLSMPVIELCKFLPTVLFWSARTTRLARIGVGCDGTNTLVVLCHRF
jgi:hypothetical protein